MHQIVFGTAGHIDHGKTALVKALTGTNTDCLPEEKTRGISIDIGFAYLNDRISIIDVPGHEKFIRNMTSGAANVHFALIVIAIDDGIMPQTVEHLNILKILGVNKGIVALTKLDLVNDEEWITLIEEDIKSLLSSMNFFISDIHRIDSITGKGVEELKSGMLSFLDNDIKYSRITDFRMNVDRVFSKTGFGTVITGTVIGGVLSKGDTIEIFPQEISAKVRGLQSHGGIVDTVKSGDRAAINISNIRGEKIKRGTIIGSPGSFSPTKYIIANISLIEKTKWKLKNNQRLRFHFGTQEVLGRILLAGNIQIQSYTSLNLFIILEVKVSVLYDEKFLIRSYSPVETIGGGIVLERIFNYRWKTICERVVQMPLKSKDRFYYLVNLDWRKPLTLDEWRNVFQITDKMIKSWITKNLIHDQETGFIFSLDNINKSKTEIKSTFNYFYKKNPFRKILNIDVLIKKLNWDENWLNYIINQLVEEKIIIKSNGGYSYRNYELILSNQDKKEISEVRSLLKTFHNQPVLIKEIISKLGFKPKRTSNLLFFLLDRGEIEFIGQDLWLDKNFLNNIISNIKIHFKSKKELTINDFKLLTGLSRKTAIPLLEYFDSKKITFRNKDVREIGSKLN